LACFFIRLRRINWVYPELIAKVLLRRDITPEKLADNLGEAKNPLTAAGVAKTSLRHDEVASATQAGYRWDHGTKCLPGAGARVYLWKMPL